jgi:hypothetical protein
MQDDFIKTFLFERKLRGDTQYAPRPNFRPETHSPNEAFFVCWPIQVLSTSTHPHEHEPV